jgi:hypothetical protein
VPPGSKDQVLLKAEEHVASSLAVRGHSPCSVLGRLPARDVIKWQVTIMHRDNPHVFWPGCMLLGVPQSSKGVQPATGYSYAPGFFGWEDKWSIVDGKPRECMKGFTGFVSGDVATFMLDYTASSLTMQVSRGKKALPLRTMTMPVPITASNWYVCINFDGGSVFHWLTSITSRASGVRVSQ